MIKPFSPAILITFLWVFSACTGQTSVEPASIQNTRDIIDTLQTNQQVPGLQLAVWKSGETVFSEGFGYADLEQNVPVTPGTKMRIGSVSKTLTSVAIGKLLENDKLNLEAPIQEYATYFPEKRYPISVRRVAGHTAGIRHYRGDEFLLNKRFDSVRESLEIFDDDTLMFEPGTDYSYSSYGWNLISAVVEESSGEPFLDYMEREVFNPLEMNNTLAEYTDSLVTNRTSYYTLSDEGDILNAPTVDNSYKWAGGGFIGTAEDLLAFGENFFWGNVLQSKTVDLLIESHELESGEKTNYGIGWRTGTDEDGRRYYGHSGGSVGGTTQFVVYPDQEVIVAIIANMGGVSYREAHLNIAKLFIDEEDN